MFSFMEVGEKKRFDRKKRRVDFVQSSGDGLLQLRLSAAFAAGKLGSPQPHGALLVSDAQCTTGRAVLAMDSHGLPRL
jgi:hypothetical protein